MFTLEITILNTLLYTLIFSGLYYIGLCFYAKRIVTIEPWKLAYYISLFCLFGVSGEILVNNLWKLSFSVPLWQYQLYPAHNGDISYFFLFIWGGLGYYRYLNDTTIHNFKSNQVIRPGIIMGAESVLLELAYNGLFFLLFNSYVFYYLPANLGILSHLSCWQVIPFYFIVGFFTARVIHNQNKLGYNKSLIPTLLLYWMVIFTLVFFK